MERVETRLGLGFVHGAAEVGVVVVQGEDLWTRLLVDELLVIDGRAAGVGALGEVAAPAPELGHREVDGFAAEGAVTARGRAVVFLRLAASLLDRKSVV